MKKVDRKLVSKMLEDIGEGNKLKSSKYSVSEECFSSMLDYIKSKDLARGLCVRRTNKRNNLKVSSWMNPYVTIKGINYINANL